MSRTKSVVYAQNGFWAYDVALGVFLKYLLDAAVKSPEAATPWLTNELSSWRASACIQDIGLELNADWSEEQRRTFITLAEEVCSNLATRDSIPAEEMACWSVFKGEGIFSRGEKEVFTASVVELGRAIIALVAGNLPESPQSEAWFYGTPSGRSTIRMRPSWNGCWGTELPPNER